MSGLLCTCFKPPTPRPAAPPPPQRAEMVRPCPDQIHAIRCEVSRTRSPTTCSASSLGSRGRLVLDERLPIPAYEAPPRYCPASLVVTRRDSTYRASHVDMEGQSGGPLHRIKGESGGPDP